MEFINTDIIINLAANFKCMDCFSKKEEFHSSFDPTLRKFDYAHNIIEIGNNFKWLLCHFYSESYVKVHTSIIHRCDFLYTFGG